LDATLAVLGQSPAREILALVVGALLSFVIERVRNRLSRNSALTAEAAKIRIAAFGRVLGALGPVAAFLAVFSIRAHTEEDGHQPVRGMFKEYTAATEAAWGAVSKDYLLIGPHTARVVMGFLGYADRLVEVLRKAGRESPERAEVLTKLPGMVESLERALPRYARLPGESHFGQQDVAEVYTDVGIWVRRRGGYEVAEPGE